MCTFRLWSLSKGGFHQLHTRHIFCIMCNHFCRTYLHNGPHVIRCFRCFTLFRFDFLQRAHVNLHDFSEGKLSCAAVWTEWHWWMMLISCSGTLSYSLTKQSHAKLLTVYDVLNGVWLTRADFQSDNIYQYQRTFMFVVHTYFTSHLFFIDWDHIHVQCDTVTVLRVKIRVNCNSSSRK